MVSETPLTGRCGARVTTKVGLKVQLGVDPSIDVAADAEPELTLTSDTIALIALDAPDPSAPTIVGVRPEYDDVRQYLWNDYTTVAVAIDTRTASVPESLGSGFVSESQPLSTEAEQIVGAETIPDIVLEDGDPVRWVDLRSITTNVTNLTTELDGYCERYPVRDEEHGRCNDHRPGPGAPEPVDNAIEHGLYAQRTNFYEQLDADEKGFVEALVNSWIEQSPYDRDNTGVINELYRAAIDQLRAWGGIEEFVADGEIQGLTQEQTVFDGEEVHEIEEEHPANLPYSRLDRDIQSKLKQLDVYESPESQQADATASLAQKLSGLSDE